MKRTKTKAAAPPAASPAAPPPNPTRAARPSSRRVAVVAAGVAFAAIAAAGVVWKAQRGGDEPSKPRRAADRSITESYPVLNILVTDRAGSKDPARPPRSAADAARRVVSALRAPGADFAAIAQVESDDSVTAADGGFFAFVSKWRYHGKAFVDSIVDVAARLEVGAVSDPFPVPDGLMIFKRLSREDGKREEARVLAKVYGILVGWHEIDGAIPAAQTRAAAYSATAAVASDLRSGALAKIEDAMARLAGVQATQMVLRKGTAPHLRALATAVLTAEPDQWLDPVETEGGWALMRRRAYVRAIVRHIIVTHEKSAEPVPKNTRSIEEAKTIAEAALARVRKDPSSWDQVVAESSDEPGSKAIGGFLGEMTTVGDPDHTLEPEIEETILALKPGEISDITPSRYGLHIYFRVD